MKAPLFENKQHGFQVTVYSEENTVSGSMSGTTSEKVLALIKDNSLLTIPQLAKLIQVY